MASQKLDSLLDFAEILGQQKDYEETLRLVVHQAADLLGYESATIMMLNPRTRQTVKTIFREHEQATDGAQHKIHVHVSGWIIKHKKSFMSADLSREVGFAKHLFREMSQVAVLGVPLWIEGAVIGVLVLAKSNSEAFSIEYDLPDLEKFAAVVAPYLHNVQKIQQYFEPPIREDALLAKYAAIGLLGRSKKFIEMLHAIEAAAHCEVRVLLEGQSGTGKELIARAIHQFSSRSNHPFVAIDCGAMPPNLIESELFGYLKGAFTGATTDRKGLLEEADGGTLFMDEIASLPLEMQSKFIRVLQEGEVRPLGSNKIRRVNVRIIAASSNSLRKMVESQKFREDLFFRLYVYPIRIPSLDERQEDIPLLANHFLKKFSSQQGKLAESFHEAILDFMRQRHWAGNIRELENLIERLVTLAAPNMAKLDRDLLPQDLRREMKKFETGRQETEVVKPLNESLSEYEEQLLRQALTANQWNIAKTARELRIAEQTLRYKMANLRIIRSKAPGKK